jgi:streptogramin lyase
MKYADRSRWMMRRRDVNVPTSGRSRSRAPRLEWLESRTLLTLSIAEFPIPTINSAPQQITAGTDGNLWFTDPGTNQVGRLNPLTGAITEYPIPTSNSLPTGITAGPDGNVWFTEQDANQVAKIDPSSGAITEYPLPAPGLNPTSITFGPDGNLWFAETGADQLGSLNPQTGLITEHPTTAILGAPANLTIGPDQRVSFTDTAGSQIGWINTKTGVVTVEPVLGSGSLTSLGAGSDGKLWFTDQSSASHYGSLNPVSGAVNIAPAIVNPFFPSAYPTTLKQLRDATAGRDGNVWFTDAADRLIVSVNPSTGAASTYAIPVDGSTPTGLTDGPDGNLWYIDGFNHRIGEVVLDGAVTATSFFLGATNSILTAGQSASLWGGLAAGPASAAVTGSITLTIDGQPQTPTAVTGDHFSLNTTALDVGEHTIVAAYSGNAVYRASVSNAIVIRVNTAPAAPYNVHLTPTAQVAGNFPALALGADGMMWLANGNQLERLNPATGSVTEVVIPSGQSQIVGITSGPDGKLWFTDAGTRSIGKFDPSTGAVTEYRVTLAPAPGLVPQQIVVTPDGQIWFTFNGSPAIGEFNPRTGQSTWDFPGSSVDWVSALAVGPKGALWFSQGGNTFGMLDPRTRNVTTYHLPAGSGMNGPFAVGRGGNLWYTTNSFTMGQFNPQTRAVTLHPFPKPPLSGYLTQAMALALGSDGNIEFTATFLLPIPVDFNGSSSGGPRFEVGSINPKTGAFAQHLLPVTLQSPPAIAAGAGGTVWLAGAAPGVVYEVTPNVATAQQYVLPHFGQGNAQIAGDGDANLWIISAGVVGKYNTATGVLIYDPSTAASYGSGAITLGPDGALWFTELDTEQLGRLDPATGKITQYPIPQAGPGGAVSISGGPDGRLWFTAPNLIGRLDPKTGTVTTFALPAPVGVPGGIAGGSDGAMWFTSPATNQIDRLDPQTGAISAFTVPSIHSNPSAITTGPSQDLWFIEDATGKVGRLDLGNGTITEITVPTGAGGAPGLITTWPDGNVWFTQPSTNTLVSINPATGDLFVHQTNPTALPITALEGLWGITSGPNGQVWFSGANMIGAIVSQPTTTTIVTPTAPLTATGTSFLTAVVSTTGSQTPTGTVTFWVDGQAQTPVPLKVVQGQVQASLPLSAVQGLVAGFHTVTATYNGSSLCVGSTSSTLSVAILTTGQQPPVLVDPTFAYSTTTENGSAAAPLTVSIPAGPLAIGELYFRIFDVTNPSKPVLLAGPVKFASNAPGITIANHPLADGLHLLAYTSSATANGPQGPMSSTRFMIVDTHLSVVSVSPSDMSTTTSGLPGGKVSVTFNHPLAGLTPTSNGSSAGYGFGSIPFAVALIPRGPDGAFSPADSPIPATLTYVVNPDYTSTITLTPRIPLTTDDYMVDVSSKLRDVAGNHLTGNTASGDHDTTFVFRQTADTSAAPGVVSVTTQHGTMPINNNTITVPDTIAIAFNKPLDFLTINTSSVQLLAGPSKQPVSSGVAYDPATKTIDLTPAAMLNPNTVYTIRVAATVTDDRAFPNTGTGLAQPFTTTFRLGIVRLPVETSPFRILNGGNGQLAPWPTGSAASLDYVSVPFSEPLKLSAIQQGSIVLTQQSGGLNDTAFDAGDPAVNVQTAFNPNTNQLIVVPTTATGTGRFRLALTNLTSITGEHLIGGATKGGPVDVPFKIQPSPTVVRSSVAAHDLFVSIPAGPAAKARPVSRTARP